ncbi:RNA polymerase II elongation factor ELL-like [Thalassophryne amazonica]|uniref:RNA polymerase II elongation factor ELL-like n=1 Tax=Thalassophryne amazonica TaxID=390379 RepID=UPI0014719B9B|nr:RNA polymerase II elongation factor ELL-like [Thalassophryne amazonica]
MSALRQEHSYGLSSTQISKNTKQSLYHVKLTDSAIRMLETYQNLKTSQSKPTICFKENQVYMKIPALTPDDPDATKIIRFNLSIDGSENPQSSFQCIQQYVSGDNTDHLESMGHIQGKMTVCATEQSYQETRKYLSQMEKPSQKRSAIEIERRPTKFGKVQSKWSLMPGSRGSSSSSSSSSKHSLCKRSQVLSPVACCPLRECIVHRLALRPHKKPDLVLWLERQRSDSEDMAELTSVLEEVSNWNPAADCYSLKMELFTHVQTDWPGYKSEEKQLIGRLLSRKRPSQSDLSNGPDLKKQRTSVQPVAPQMPSHEVQWTNPTSSSFHGTSGNPHRSALSSAYIHKGHTGKATVTSTSATPLPNYVNKYSTITSLEQRQKYEEEFDAEYHEYETIHDRIAAAAERFLQMTSELDSLPPGTEAYQQMRYQVLEKYRIYQKWFPGYRKDKRKCLYLHHKLAHIKERIEDYDHAQETRI